MRLVLLIIIAVLMCGCNQFNAVAPNCSVNKVTGGTKISCDGYKSFIIPDGAAGPQGPQGNSGNTGDPGRDGYSLVAVTVPALPSQCSNGGSLVQIAVDSNYDLLWESTDYQQSSFIACNGVDAAQVSMVQLCAGSTTYPTSFPEFGTCVNDQLYGVYWDGHNAWQALIAPGTWNSTSSSVPCSFTVGPNCQVTY